MRRFVSYTNLILILVAISAFVWWVVRDPWRHLVASEPGMDHRPAGLDSITEVIRIGSVYNLYGEASSQLLESWPRFRGSDFDNISKSAVPLINSFPATGPDILWSVELGEGHAGASIYQGKLYLMDYLENSKADMLRCFDLVSGTELWQRGYQVNVKRNHGMSRTVPAVTDKYILTIGPRAHIMCLDREDGTFRWGIDVEKDYRSEIPFWYTGQCPLIDNGVAVIATGGEALMIGVDCETGEKLWETPTEPGWKMSHASIIPWDFGGRRMYVYSAVGVACGIVADGEDAGKILWKTSKWNHSVVAPSALCLPDGRIFLSAGYGSGSMVLKIHHSAGQYEVEILDSYKPVEGLSSEQQTPLFWNGHVFGILPKDAGPLRNQFVCVNPSDFKKVIWSSGQENRYGLGPYILADNKFFILSDDGVLTILRPSTSSFIQLDKVKLFDGHDAWAPIAVADGYMVLRDSKTMICVNLNL